MAGQWGMGDCFNDPCLCSDSICTGRVLLIPALLVNDHVSPVLIDKTKICLFDYQQSDKQITVTNVSVGTASMHHAGPSKV